MSIARLKLVRREFGDHTTGRLYLNGQFFCWTLEDVVRRGKIEVVKKPGQTAIPAGTYKVTAKAWLGTIQAFAPLLKNVPGFQGIFMHNGVDINSTLGCIILSYSKPENGRVESDQAFADLRDLIVKDDEAYIKIVNDNRIKIALGIALAFMAVAILINKGVLKIKHYGS